MWKVNALMMGHDLIGQRGHWLWDVLVLQVVLVDVDVDAGGRLTPISASSGTPAAARLRLASRYESTKRLYWYYNSALPQGLRTSMYFY